MNSTQTKKLVIVTGANKGIGLQIVKDILKLDSSYSVILTSRDLKRGQEAINEIESSQDVKGRLFYEQLDIENEESIDAFVKTIQNKYKSFYSLINNAAVAFEVGTTFEDLQKARIDEISVKTCLKINVRGTISLIEKILPFLEDNGRVINVSSIAGILQFQGEDVVKIHTNPKLTEKEFYSLLDDYESVAYNYGHIKLGYNPSIYCDSKLFLNTYTRLVLKNHLKKTQTAFALHPGVIKTDLNKGGYSSVEEGTLSTLTALKFDDKEALENNFKFINNDGKFIDY